MWSMRGEIAMKSTNPSAEMKFYAAFMLTAFGTIRLCSIHASRSARWYLMRLPNLTNGMDNLP